MTATQTFLPHGDFDTLREFRKTKAEKYHSFYLCFIFLKTAEDDYSKGLVQDLEIELESFEGKKLDIKTDKINKPMQLSNETARIISIDFSILLFILLRFFCTLGLERLVNKIVEIVIIKIPNGN